MTSEDFVVVIMNSVVKGNVENYRVGLPGSSADATDPYWKSVSAVFDSLSEADRGTLVELVREVSIDACATMLGMLDNVVAAQGLHGELSLACDGTVISGDLKDHFLNLVADAAT